MQGTLTSFSRPNLIFIKGLPEAQSISFPLLEHFEQERWEETKHGIRLFLFYWIIST